MSLRNGTLRVIRNEANLGFGLACNQGMDLARGEGVLLLNNDAIVLGDWLPGLWDALPEAAEGGMSGPITNFGRPTQVRQLPEPRSGEDPAAIFAEWTRSHAGMHTETDVLSGFCLLMRRRVIERLGGFDPCYGLGYFEDDDYSLRARLAGFALRICEGVLVYHHGAVTSKATGLVSGSAAHSQAKWAIFRDKWRLPAERQPHQFSVEEVRRIWHGAPPLHVPLKART
jgi:GT2 family glycosyltransferase